MKKLGPSGPQQLKIQNSNLNFFSSHKIFSPTKQTIHIFGIFPSFWHIWNVKFENVWDEGESVFLVFFLGFVKVVEMKT